MQSNESPVSARPQRPSAPRMNSRHVIRPSISQSSRWSTLPSRVKFFLKYHQTNLSYNHYAFKVDSGDFLKTTFLEIALNDGSGALLYAIVAFSAYHYALEQGNARISGFLEYYNQSITYLSQSLKSKKPGITTLLTILQLATIEVSIHTAITFDKTSSPFSGIPRRLDQFVGTPKSSAPDTVGPLHTPDNHARRDASKDHRVVHTFRPVRGHDVGRRDEPKSRLVRRESRLLRAQFKRQTGRHCGPARALLRRVALAGDRCCVAVCCEAEADDHGY